MGALLCVIGSALGPYELCVCVCMQIYILCCDLHCRPSFEHLFGTWLAGELCTCGEPPLQQVHGMMPQRIKSGPRYGSARLLGMHAGLCVCVCVCVCV